MKEININECHFHILILHQTEPLVLQVEIYTKSDQTPHRLHQAEPLVAHAKISGHAPGE